MDMDKNGTSYGDIGGLIDSNVSPALQSIFCSVSCFPDCFCKWMTALKLEVSKSLSLLVSICADGMAPNTTKIAWEPCPLYCESNQQL